MTQYKMMSERIEPDRENVGEYARDPDNGLLKRIAELKAEGCFVIDFKSYFCGRELKWFYFIVYERPQKMENSNAFTEQEVVNRAEKEHGASICIDKIEEAMRASSLEEAADILINDTLYWELTYGL